MLNKTFDKFFHLNVVVISMDVIRVFAGFVLIMLGLSLLTIQSVESVEYGSVILIGPIPIIIASDAGLASIAILLAVIMVAMILLMARW